MTVDRKWLVTALRRCAQCKLLYRAPTTSVEENAAFYQSEYEQGATTDMPSDAALAHLIATKFAGHERNYDAFVSVLRALGVGQEDKVFEFGCSWGYGSFQLAQAGYSVDAFEISKPRAEFAREKLGVSLKSRAEVKAGAYDVFFSSHVIEHVPSVAEMIEFGMRSLKPGGLFVAFTPNGSASFRSVLPNNWHKSWGLVHPQLIDEVFLMRNFSSVPLIITSSPHPLQSFSNWKRTALSEVVSLEGAELFFAIQKPLS